MTTATVIIPWRDKGNPRRRANLRRVLRHLEAGGWPYYLADDGRADDEPFGRQHAYNRGIAAQPADAWVFYEADMIVPHEQIEDALAAALAAPGLVVPFSVRHELDAESSIDVAAGAPPQQYPPEASYRGSYGAVNVVSAETMRLVGQWDERLTGHWYDDTAMLYAFETATGNPVRYIDGPGWHLWHPTGYTPNCDPADFHPSEVEATNRNRQRCELYRTAATPERIRHLTAGGD